MSTRTPQDYCELFRAMDAEYDEHVDSPLHHDNRCPVHTPRWQLVEKVTR